MATTKRRKTVETRLVLRPKFWVRSQGKNLGPDFKLGWGQNFGLGRSLGQNIDLGLNYREFVSVLVSVSRAWSH